MTDNERALLLAVAKYVHPYVVKKFSGLSARSLDERIAAVEAEAAPEAPADGKSCETCSSYLAMYDKCLYPRDGECLPTHKYWQPKPTEAVCPVCEGGKIAPNGYVCDNCKGTGKKENK